MAALYLAKTAQLDIIDDTTLARGQNGSHLSSVRPPQNGSYLSTVGGSETGYHSSTVKPDENGYHSSTVGLKRLDARRRKAEVPVQDLCNAAGIHINTYREGVAGRAETSPRVMTALTRALASLSAGEDAPTRRTLCAATVRFLTIHVARHVGVDPQGVLDQDFSKERPTDKAWLQAARIRRCAVYLLVEGLRVGAAAVANAIGQKRQAVHKAIAAIEAERERDTEFDALMKGLMWQLTGEAK